MELKQFVEEALGLVSDCGDRECETIGDECFHVTKTDLTSIISQVCASTLEKERQRILEILRADEIMQRMFDMDGMVSLSTVEAQIRSHKKDENAS
jgi:hypothetical protein